jgi:radical SAM-linked protein
VSRQAPVRDFAPTVQRLRIRYAKRGRLRFTSHRDFQRALERAIRRAGVPVAFSTGFSPHPKISYSNSAPTGAASEAEYVEIGVTIECDPGLVATALDSALPPGLDIVDVVVASSSDFAARLEASRWRIELPEADRAQVESAVTAFLAADEVEVQRLMKSGMRTFDARSAVAEAFLLPESASGAAGAPDPDGCVILELVVRHTTPSVRPDDVLSALRRVADLVPPAPPRVTRLAQGPLDPVTCKVNDPFEPDRAGVE